MAESTRTETPGGQGQCLLRAGQHDLNIPRLHIEFIRKERTDGVHDEKKAVFPAEAGDQPHIVVYAGGGFVYIDQESGKAFACIRREMIGGQCLTGLKADFFVRNFMELAEIRKTLPEAAAVDDQHFIVPVKQIHDGRFHGGRAGTGQKDRSGIVAGLGKFFHKPFIFQHDSGKFRGTEIGNLFRADGAHTVRGLYRSTVKFSIFSPYLCRS